MTTKTAMAALAASTALALPAQAFERDGETHSEKLTREMTFEVRAESVNEDNRTVELSFSSDEPYERWWGVEILDHKSSAIRLGRLNGSAALLMDHNIRDQVGVVEKAWLKGKKGYAIVRFGKSARAEEVWQDVKDGIRKLVSVGYRIHELVLEKEKDGLQTYRATDWEPYEISIVAVPADTSVGVGRDGKPDGYDPRTLIHEEDEDMNLNRNDSGGGAAPVATDATRGDGTSPAPAVAAAAPTVDLAAMRTAEIDRMNSIRTMGERLGCRELAEKAINEGQSTEDFIKAYNAAVPQSQAVRTAESPAIGLTEREVDKFSFVRLLAALANPNDISARNAAGFELECSEAAGSRGHQMASKATHRIPYDILAAGSTRDLVVGTATLGGNLVATELKSNSFIDMLLNSMALEQMGITTLTDLNGNIAIPRQTGGATGFWVAESGAVTESDLTFDQVTLTPKTVGAMSDISRQLLLQSSLSVEQLVRRDLALRIALEMDRAGINGSGASNQPRGLLNTSGIGSVAAGTNGAAPTWDMIVNLETQVDNANGAVGNLGYLTNSRVRGRMKRTQRFSGTDGVSIWDKGEMNGYKAVVSNQVPSNLTKGTSTGVCSAIMYGNWSDLLMGLWGGLDLLVNPYIGSGTGTVRIEVFQTADITVRQPGSFAALVDALTV
jgi:HK97 family phage major capsid protein